MELRAQVLKVALSRVGPEALRLSERAIIYRRVPLTTGGLVNDIIPASFN